jgi:transcriptional regulator with XRE-family HTH domain
MITAAQIRAARALLRWTQEELAEAANVSVPTLKRWEGSSGVPAAEPNNLAAVRRALEKAGVVFIDENGGGAGARLRKK